MELLLLLYIDLIGFLLILILLLLKLRVIVRTIFSQ